MEHLCRMALNLLHLMTSVFITLCCLLMSLSQSVFFLSLSLYLLYLSFPLGLLVSPHLSSLSILHLLSFPSHSLSLSLSLVLPPQAKLQLSDFSLLGSFQLDLLTSHSPECVSVFSLHVCV